MKLTRVSSHDVSATLPGGGEAEHVVSLVHELAEELLDELESRAADLPPHELTRAAAIVFAERRAHPLAATGQAAAAVEAWTWQLVADLFRALEARRAEGVIHL